MDKQICKKCESLRVTRHGSIAGGNPRYRCMACLTTWSNRTPRYVFDDQLSKLAASKEGPLTEEDLKVAFGITYEAATRRLKRYAKVPRSATYP